MHADVLGDVAQNQGAQVLDAAVQEIALELDQALGHLEDGALALLDALDEPDGRAHLLADVLLGLLVHGAAGLGLRRVERVDPQVGHPLVVQDHHVLVAHLVHEDVRGDVLHVVGPEDAPGLGVQLGDDLGGGEDVVDLDAEHLGGLLVAAALQVLQVVAQQRLDDGAAHPQARHLDQQALAQVAGPDADRVEFLDPFQHPFGKRQEHALGKPLGGILDAGARGVRVEPGPLQKFLAKGAHLHAGIGHIRKTRPEIAVLVDVADDFQPERHFAIGQAGEAQLPDQVIGEGRLLG